MRKLGMWMAGLVLLLTMPSRVSAAQLQEAVIPVAVQAEGAVRPCLYTVELIPETPGSPMPEGSIGNLYRLTMETAGEIRIPCDTLGVFDYRIRQTAGEQPGCTYDTQEYRLRLFVTAAEDGTTVVTAQLYGQQGEKLPKVLFRNYWARPAQLQLSAWKTLDGKTPEDGAFSFRLISEEGVILHQVENVGRYVTFPVMTFDQPGTYRYFLKEVRGTNGKIVYDRTVYTVTVEVTLERDYKINVSYLRNGKIFSGTPSFANYTDTGNPKTGDSIGTAFAVLVISGVGLAGICCYKRKKHEQSPP